MISMYPSLMMALPLRTYLKEEATVVPQVLRSTVYLQVLKESLYESR